MMRVKNLRVQYLLIVPILILFAAGFLMKSTDKVIPQTGCVTSNFTGEPTTEAFAEFRGIQIEAPSVALASAGNVNVLGTANPNEKWVEVDLSEQKLRAWEGDQVYLETLVSSGLPGTPTPTGEFRVWVKLRATKMEGGSGNGYYYLPNVPYVMYFGNSDVPNWRGYGLHGTYWHNDFGSPRSHGCVNLPTPVAEKLFKWVLPVNQDGRNAVYSSPDNPGIRVVIHD